MDRLGAMAVFAQVVEAEGFSAAARQLGIAKSSVSKQVSRLEDELGVRLLNRTTRRLSLTEAGRTFFQGCQRVVAEASAAESAVTHLATAPRGRLNVGVPMSFGQRHISPVLPLLLSRCPELTVDLALNDRFVDLVEEGFDLGVRIAQLKDSSLIARRLAPSRNVVCAAPEYLAAHGIPRTVEDLSAHECLLYSYQVSGGKWRFVGPGGRREMRVRGRLRANSGESLLATALAGFGVVRLPTFICGDALRDGRLIRLLPEWGDPQESVINAIYPASRNLSPKVRVFIDFLVEQFSGDVPYWDRDLNL
ncbi:MAG: LysR family transcriptional regulator [Alphaproteobacteria bacterium]